ncbi:MAG TPA: aldo/keto reductase [Casimicrobiaceae bacterium]|nr:aldo/keto reductase [Casimicrobiaceae bacterium]
MERQKLGRTGFDVAPLALGGNVFGWTADEATSFRVLDAFVDAGGNLIDTADSYSRWAPGHAGGESETVIGRWIARRGRHDDVVIATKVGSDMGQGKCLRRDYILRAAEQSLSRLHVDAIDLYQSHWDDETTPFDETLDAYARLIEQGKVKAIGASNLSAARLSQALEVSAREGLPRYQTLQPLYNLYSRDEFEGALCELCLREDVGVITYFSLAAGFLTGKYRTAADATKSARGEGIVKKYLNPRGMAILDALDNVASRVHATPAQVALAWLMARPGVTAAIASATSVDQLRELVGAMRLALDEVDMRELDAASDPSPDNVLS